jgi:hypothetical protein
MESFKDSVFCLEVGQNNKAAGSAALKGFSNMVINNLCTKSKNHTLSAWFVKEYFFGENFDCLQ